MVVWRPATAVEALEICATSRVLLVLLACLAYSSIPLRSQNPQATVTAEECAVYTAVLNRVSPTFSRRAHLVASSTLGSIPFGRTEVIGATLETMPEVDEALRAAYRERNATEAGIPRGCIRPRIPVRLLSAEEREEIGKATMDVDGYPESYPAGGEFMLSRVGFSDDGTLAVLHVLMRCGGRCGGGSVVLLRRVCGEWAETARERTIIF